jgi:hypothetical protein
MAIHGLLHLAQSQSQSQSQTPVTYASGLARLRQQIAIRLLGEKETAAEEHQEIEEVTPLPHPALAPLGTTLPDQSILNLLLKSLMY